MLWLLFFLKISGAWIFHNWATSWTLLHGFLLQEIRLIELRSAFAAGLTLRDARTGKKPSTQKTLIFDMMGKVLKIYNASSRKNFTGAHNYYDLWLFDEFWAQLPLFIHLHLSE